MDQNGFFCGVIIKSSRQLHNLFFRRYRLKFDAGGEFTDIFAAHGDLELKQTDLSLLPDGLVKFRAAVETDGMTFHSHDADGGSGAPALLVIPHRSIFDIDGDLRLKIGPALNKKSVPRPEFPHTVTDSAERFCKRRTVIFIVSSGGNIKSSSGLQHGTCSEISRIDS